MNKAGLYFALSSLALGASIFVACSDDTVPLRPIADGGGTTEAGNTGDSGGGTHPGQAQQTGRVVDLGQQGTGVAGATIQIGGQTLQTDAKGNYSVLYPLNTPVSMVVTAPCPRKTPDGTDVSPCGPYYKLLEAEWLLKQDSSRGPTRLPSVDTASALLTALGVGRTPVDQALGVISVWAIPMTGCPSEAGATFEISPTGPTTQHVYLKSTFPDGTLTSAAAGENPHVVFYNVPLGEVTVTVTHPTCSQLPYPQTDTDGFTYTGKATVEGNAQVLSFLRVFLGPHVSPDAGTDSGSDSGTDSGSDASDASDQ